MRSSFVKAIVKSKPVKKVSMQYLTKKEKKVESNANCDFEIHFFDESDQRVSSAAVEKLSVKAEVLGEGVKMTSACDIAENVPESASKVSQSFLFVYLVSVFVWWYFLKRCYIFLLPFFQEVSFVERKDTSVIVRNVRFAGIASTVFSIHFTIILPTQSISTELKDFTMCQGKMKRFKVH
jgi:hypothetical protein